MGWFSQKSAKEEHTAEEVLHGAYELVGTRRDAQKMKFREPIYVETAFWYDEHRSNSQHLPYMDARVFEILGRRWALAFARGDHSSNWCKADLTALDLGELTDRHVPVDVVKNALVAQDNRYFRNSLARTDSMGDILCFDHEFPAATPYGVKMHKALDSRIYACVAKAPVTDQGIFLTLIREPRKYHPSAVEVIANAIETVLIDCSVRPAPKEDSKEEAKSSK